jgi:hypothetical protein
MDRAIPLSAWVSAVRISAKRNIMENGIPDGIPVRCETCLYLASREQCDGCLTDAPDSHPDAPCYLYRHHEAGTFGQAMERQHQRQVAGIQNIVISGQGEAEVNARWSVAQAYKSLVDVSEACGYLTHAPQFNGDQASIRILAHGEWFLIWKSGVFERIEDSHGIAHWDRHQDFIKLKYSHAAYCRYGLKR